MFLEVKDLNVNLGQFHLVDFNLKLKKKDYMVIVGPTGSGKSVFLETIAGFYRPQSGKILLEGKDITNLNPEKRGISIIYQDFVLFPHMDVSENIAYGLKKKVEDKEMIESKVTDVAKRLRISHLLDRNPETLSGGEKQRTAIARSLIVEPNLLLMDEPFSALDVNTHAYLTDLLKKAVSDYQTTCIHVTHNFNDVWSLAEQVAVMNDGEILQQGIVADVFSKPNYDFVADFVGVGNIFQGEVIGQNRDITKVKVAENLIIYSSDTYNTDSKKVVIVVRPENIILSNQPFVSSMRNQLNGIVTEIVLIGPTVWVETDVQGTSFKGIITPASLDMLGIKKGKEIYLSFKSINAKLIDND